MPLRMDVTNFHSYTMDCFYNQLPSARLTSYKLICMFNKSYAKCPFSTCSTELHINLFQLYFYYILNSYMKNSQYIYITMATIVIWPWRVLWSSYRGVGIRHPILTVHPWSFCWEIHSVCYAIHTSATRYNGSATRYICGCQQVSLLKFDWKLCIYLN